MANTSSDPLRGGGVIYTGPELVGYRVLIVPLELIDKPWVKEARGEE